MAGRSVDVSLRIKAQDEASKALDAVGKALKDLAGAQSALAGGSSGVGKFVESLSQNVDGLSTLFKKLDTTLAGTNRAYENQSRQLAAVNGSIIERKRRIEELTSAEADLQRIQGSFKNISPAKQATFIGPVPPKLTAVRRDIGIETNALAKEEASLGRLISKIAEARNANETIKAVQGQVATAINATTAAFVEQANALDKLVGAEQRAAREALVRQQRRDLADRVAATTGTNNTPTPESLRPRRQAELEATFAKILERESETEAKITAEQVKQTEELRKQAELASRAVQNRINSTTGVGRTPTPESLRPRRQAELEATFAPIFAAQDATAIKEATQAFDAFEARAKQGAAALQQVRAYARDVAEALDPVAKVTRLVAEEQSRLSEAVRLGALSQQQADTALLKYKQNLDGSAAATERQSREFEQLSTYVQELRRDFDRAGYADQFLTREKEKLNRAVKAGILAQNEYAKALETVKRKSEQLGEQSNPSLFGLNPYQTQNLMFQFNDIATQLASGTSLTQTLAQQGGQILQLFPKVGNAIIGAFRGAPALIGLTATAFLGIGVAISRALENAERLRTFDAILKSNADGATFTAKALGDAARSIQRFGIDAENSISIVRLAVQRGFAPDVIQTFAKSAKGLSIILGTDVAAAATELATAMRGGFDAISDLDDKTNLLTASERQLIRELFEQGKATEATELATRLFNDRLNETASNAEGPWSKAIRELGSAWNDLLETIANSAPIQAAVQGLTNLINLARDAANFANGVNTVQEKQARLQDIVTTEFGGLRDRATATRNGYVAKPGFERDDTTLRQMEEANRLQREISAEQGKANDALIKAERAATEQATQRVQKADAEVKAATARLETEKKITSEADVRRAVEQKRKELLLQAQSNPDFKGATDAAINGYVDTQLGNYRIGLEERLTSYKKQQADDAERSKKAAEAEAKERLKLATNDQLVTTAQKFSGFSENDSRQRAGLKDFFKQSGINVDPKMVAWCAAFVNAVLGANGLPQTGSLAARSFVDYGKDTTDNPKRGDIVVLKRGDNQSQGHVGFFLGYDKKGNIIVLGGNQSGGQAVSQSSFKPKDVLSIRRAPTQGDVAVEAAKEENKTEAALEKFNTALDDRLDKEERSIANQRALVGLQGDALRAEIERQQVAEAIAQATDDLQRTVSPDATLTQEQVDRITVDVKARLKLDEPQKVAADLQKQVDDLQGSRSLLESKLQQKQSVGDVGGMREVQKQIEDIDARIAQAAQTYLDFLNTPGNADALGLYGVELDNMIAKMTQLSEKTAEWKLEIGSATISASEFANAFTNSAVSALDGFAQAIANGKNAFSSLWSAFRQFAADFLLQIAKMIQQQIIFNLVSGLLKSLAGGIGGGGAAPTNSFSGGFSNFNLSSLVHNPADPLNVGMWHTGGIAGSNAPSFKAVSPALFNNAMRYHSGGIAGLKPNEVPAVLMRGEEVLTRDDPRHMMNGGGGMGNVKIVNAFDVGDAVSKGMETKAGEKAVLNLVRNNPRAFRAAMGNG